MEKVLELLEKHVQWLAIGLAGVFVVIVSWFYLIQTPVSERVGTTTVNPGTVDPVIQSGSAKRLQDAVDAEVTPAVVFKSGNGANTPDPLAAWTDVLASNQPVTPLAATAWSSTPGEGVVSTGNVVRGPEDRATGVPVITFGRIIPPTTTGKTAVLIPLRNAPVPAVPAAGGRPAAVAPVKPVTPAKPKLFDPNETAGGPTAGAAVVPVPAGFKQEDRIWVRALYSLPTLDLPQEYSRLLIPLTYKTTILRAELWRQEKLPDGTWSPAAVVPGLANSTIPAMPAEGNNAAMAAYLKWAQGDGANAQILHPLFYDRVLGDNPWGEDAVANANPAVAPEDPVARKARLAAEKTAAEEKRKSDLEKRKADAAAAKARRDANRKGSGSKGGGGGAIGGGGGGMRLVDDPDFQGPFAQASPGGLPGTPGLPGIPATPPPMEPGTPGEAGSGLPPTTPLPPAQFAPTDLAVDTDGWAFDDTVQTGKTYRYQVKWAILNPLFGFQNVAVDTKFEKQFAIWSELKAEGWGSEVTVSSLTNFFVAKAWNSNKAGKDISISVFKWQAGKWQSETFTVVPGEMVGAMKDGVDYSTGYTLVDVRYDGDRVSNDNRTTALLMGPDGKIVTRSPAADKINPVYIQLTGETTPPPPPAAAASAG